MIESYRIGHFNKKSDGQSHIRFVDDGALFRYVGFKPAFRLPFGEKAPSLSGKYSVAAIFLPTINSYGGYVMNSVGGDVDHCVFVWGDIRKIELFFSKIEAA